MKHTHTHKSVAAETAISPRPGHCPPPARCAADTVSSSEPFWSKPVGRRTQSAVQGCASTGRALSSVMGCSLSRSDAAHPGRRQQGRQRGTSRSDSGSDHPTLAKYRPSSVVEPNTFRVTSALHRGIGRRTSMTEMCGAVVGSLAWWQLLTGPPPTEGEIVSGDNRIESNPGTVAGTHGGQHRKRVYHERRSPR